MVIEARAARPFVILIPPGKRDQARSGTLTLADLPRDLVPVHIGEPDIKQDDLGPLRIDRLERGTSVMRHSSLVPHRGEQRLEHFGGIDVVVDDEHTHLNFRGVNAPYLTIIARRAVNGSSDSR
jgi:hypothetical protein